MHRASLQNSLRAHFPHRFEDIGCAVASDAFDLDTGVLNILKILPQLVQPLAVGQPIEGRHPDIRVAVKDQADFIRKVRAVDQQIDFFSTLDVPNGASGQLLVEIAFERPFTVRALFYQL